MIPKQIFQCGPWDAEKIPQYVLAYRQTWIDMNHGWKYFYSSDSECEEYIYDKCGPKIATHYQKIQRGDNRGDFWRYVCMYFNGGIYADMDTKCLAPIECWLSLNCSFAAMQNTYKQIGTIWENWFFGSVRNSEILERVIGEMLNRIELSKSKIIAYHTFFPFSEITSQYANTKNFCEIQTESKSFIQHITAHDNWGNEEFFINGGFHWNI